MTAQLHKTTVEYTLFTMQDFGHCGGHVVIDAPPAGATKKRKCTVVGIEHHLSAFTGIGHNKKMTTVTQTKMRHFYLLGNTAEDYLFMAPVKLVRISRGKA